MHYVSIDEVLRIGSLIYRFEYKNDDL